MHMGFIRLLHALKRSSAPQADSQKGIQTQHCHLLKRFQESGDFKAKRNWECAGAGSRRSALTHMVFKSEFSLGARPPDHL
jgi:hypothetical protein